jgi:hypothetical protein
MVYDAVSNIPMVATVTKRPYLHKYELPELPFKINVSCFHGFK